MAERTSPLLGAVHLINRYDFDNMSIPKEHQEKYIRNKLFGMVGEEISKHIPVKVDYLPFADSYRYSTEMAVLTKEEYYEMQKELHHLRNKVDYLEKEHAEYKRMNSNYHYSKGCIY